MSALRVPVTAPVTATVGPVHLRLFPYSAVRIAVDDYDDRPWAWGAMCRVKFRIGELSTTKKVQQRYTYTDRLGYGRSERPSEDDLAVGRTTVLDNLRTQLARHGFEPPPFVVEVHTPEPDDDEARWPPDPRSVPDLMAALEASLAAAKAARPEAPA